MEAKNNKETETKETKKENVKKEVWGYVKIIIIAALIALFCNKVLIANVKIPSESMLDTIHVGDRLIGSRLAYKFSDVERGDIAIFKYPDDECWYGHCYRASYGNCHCTSGWYRYYPQEHVY